MLARVYFIVGLALLLGYGVTAWEGWEFGNALRVPSIPPVGSSITSSGRASSSSSGRSAILIFNGGK